MTTTPTKHHTASTWHGVEDLNYFRSRTLARSIHQPWQGCFMWFLCSNKTQGVYIYYTFTWRTGWNVSLGEYKRIKNASMHPLHLLQKWCCLLYVTQSIQCNTWRRVQVFSTYALNFQWIDYFSWKWIKSRTDYVLATNGTFIPKTSRTTNFS